jgi:Tol biopolymer transport system component
MRRSSPVVLVVLTLVALVLEPRLAQGQEPLLPQSDRPAPSPDGLRIVYVSDVDGSKDLWMTDATGANNAAFVAWPTDERDPAWAPDGSSVVFSSNSGSTTHQIWRVASDGGNPTRLTNDDAEHESPRYSPNGSTILFLSNKTGKRELWLMNADGSNPRSLALIPTRVSDPSWSPTGGAIVYVGCQRGGACHLYRINADASNGSPITGGDFQDWNPDWGSQGILFASNRGGEQGLWLIQPNGSGLQQITAPAGAADLDPKWTPGGGFVFSRSGLSTADAASDIWLASSIAAAPEQVTHTAADTTPPVIVPVIAGNLGSNNWYVTDVRVTWQVTDTESGIASSTGCSETTIAADTEGVTLTCSAINGAGLPSTASVTLKVDRTPPAIAGLAGLSCSLWPPNGRLERVATVEASDAGSGLAVLDVVGVSNQPARPGESDIVIMSGVAGSRTIDLRADRLGGDSSGRLYTLTATASDVAGNVSTAQAECKVPHDQR